MRGAEGEERRGREEALTRAPFLGHGIGLRREHYAAVLAGEAACDWYEAISENYMGVGGRARKVLLAVRERFPMTLHGVSLGIGDADPLDEEYLDALAALARDVEPAWVSDHLCFTRAGGHASHDLLPLPYTEEALANVVARVQRVQERLGRVLVLENVSSYVRYRASTIPEDEFLAEVARRSGCGLLLDVNNVFVSATNHGLDPRAYLEAIPKDAVWQFHLAGPSEAGALLVDTHDHPVRPEVWELYRQAARRFGDVSSLVEWDDRIPDVSVVLAERDKAAAIAAEVRTERAAANGAGGAPHGSGPPPAVVSAAATPALNTKHRTDPTVLRGTQELFLALVSAPEGAGKALEAGGAELREAADGTFVGDGRMAATDRLEVYANMYFFRLRDSLSEDYPRTAGALGEARWHNLVTDYLLAHPPTSWSLRWAGEALPAFLRGHAYGAERPWLADVAALEQARNEAFQAEDAEPMRASELLGVHPELWPTLAFGATPGTALVESRWDLAGWWAGDGAEEPAGSPGGQALLVRRDAEDDVAHAALGASDAAPVRLLLAGAPFSDVCEACAPEGADEAAATEAGRRAADLLLRLVSLGVLRAPKPSP